MWRRASAVSSTDVVTDPSERVSDVSTGCLTKPALQVLYIFQGVFLVHSVQNFFQDSSLALRSSALYEFLRALKRLLVISLRSEFLHFLTLRFKAFASFLRAFSFSDHLGGYLAFGKNGGKQLLLISFNLYQISVIDLSSCSFVLALLTRSFHCLPVCWIFWWKMFQFPTCVAHFLVESLAVRFEFLFVLWIIMLKSIRLWSDCVQSSLTLQF